MLLSFPMCAVNSNFSNKHSVCAQLHQHEEIYFETALITGHKQGGSQWPMHLQAATFAQSENTAKQA